MAASVIQRGLNALSRQKRIVTLCSFHPSWSVNSSTRNQAVFTPRSPAPVLTTNFPRHVHTGLCVCKNRSGASNVDKGHPISPLQQSVQLLDQQGEILGQMTKKEAYKMADRQELKLLEIEGTEAGMPVFKLVTSRERIEIQKQLREERRAAGPKAEMKTLRLKSKISVHDLQIKIKHMQEFIQKGHSVRILIQNSSSDSQVMSSLFKEITSSVEDVALIKQAKDTAQTMEIKLVPIEPSDKVKGNEKLKPFTNEELKSRASGDKSVS